MNREQALRLWQDLYGDVEVAYDYASHPMKREDYENEDSVLGWTVDLKKPLKQGGVQRFDNQIPSAYSTYRLREEKSSFSVGKHFFELRRGKRYGTLDLFDVTDRNHPIDLNPQTMTQDPEFHKERKKSISNYENRTEPSSFAINDIYRKTLNEELFKLNLKKTEETPVENNVSEEIRDNEISEEITDKKAIEEENASAVESEDVISSNDEIIEETEVENNEVEEIAEIENSEEQAVEENLEDPEKVIGLKELSQEENAETIIEEQTDSLAETEKPIVDIAESIEGSKMEDQEENTDENIVSEELENNEKFENISEAVIIPDEVEPEKSEDEVESEVQDNVVASLKEEIAEKDRQLTVCIAEKNLLEKQIDMLNQLLTSFHSEESKKIQDYIGQIKELELGKQKTAEMYLTEKEKVQKLEEDLRRAMESQGDNISSLEERNKEYEERIAELEDKISVLEDEKIKLQNEVDESDQRAQRAESRGDELDQINRDNERLIKELEEKLTQNEEVKNNNEEEFAACQNELNNLKEDLLRVQEKTLADQEYISSLEKELEELRSSKNELSVQLEEAQKKSLENQDVLNNYDEAKNEYLNEIAELKKQLVEMNDDKLQLEGEKNEIQTRFIELSDKYDSLKIEKENYDSNIENSEEQLKALTEELDEVKRLLDETNKQAELDQLRTNEMVVELNAQMNEIEKKCLIMTSGGSKDYIREISYYLDSRRMEYTEENIQNALVENPHWALAISEFEHPIAEPADSIEEEIPEREIEIVRSIVEDVKMEEHDDRDNDLALELFQSYFSGKTMASDFAGRIISMRDYQDSTSPYGWDYIVLDPYQPERKDNVILMHMMSKKDFKSDEIFVTNGHSFELKTSDNGKKIVSMDSIADPFDFRNAIMITKRNKDLTSPVIYIIVRPVESDGMALTAEAVKEFYDLIDRTVKRCCTASFLEMQANLSTKNGYAFLTFDGSVEGAYKEALDYAFLLNSYRAEYKNQKILNAVLVLNEINIPLSSRHLSFDRLVAEYKDLELAAIRYGLLTTAAVDSTINRSLHIGPAIMDKVHVDKEKGKPSMIGRGNFQNAYNFTDEFRVYNFGYGLRNK